MIRYTENANTLRVPVRKLNLPLTILKTNFRGGERAETRRVRSSTVRLARGPFRKAIKSPPPSRFPEETDSVDPETIRDSVFNSSENRICQRTAHDLGRKILSHQQSGRAGAGASTSPVPSSPVPPTGSATFTFVRPFHFSRERLPCSFRTVRPDNPTNARSSAHGHPIPADGADTSLFRGPATSSIRFNFTSERPDGKKRWHRMEGETRPVLIGDAARRRRIVTQRTVAVAVCLSAAG